MRSVKDILAHPADGLTLGEFLALCDSLRYNGSLIEALKLEASEEVNGKPYFNVNDVDISIDLGSDFEEAISTVELMVSRTHPHPPLVIQALTRKDAHGVQYPLHHYIDTLRNNGIVVLSGMREKDEEIQIDLGPFVVGETNF